MISSQQFMISSQQDERSNLPSDHMVTEISAFREDNNMKIITSTVLALSLTARSLTRRTRGSSYFILKGRDDLGIGVIWIEHDMQMVAYLTDSIHVLDYGRSLADGHPDEVLKMKKSSKPISAKLE
jgi:ABC-type antimicrobial peptide transport system ATPase subunit